MKRFGLSLALLLLTAATRIAVTPDAAIAQGDAVKVKMSFAQQEVIIEMFNIPASRDFLSLLPYTGHFEDYAGAEKISYLPRKLTSPGPPAAGQSRGDFTYYSPWGNLAVFYNGSGSGGSLYILGRILSGKDKLATMKNGFTATIEIVE